MNPTSSIDVIEHIFERRHSLDLGVVVPTHNNSSNANNAHTTTTTTSSNNEGGGMMTNPFVLATTNEHQQAVEDEERIQLLNNGDIRSDNNNIDTVDFESFNWKEESYLILHLAIPTVIIQLGMTIPGFLIASYVGLQYGSTYLDGYMLANLTGNLCTLTLLQGIFSASDTLSPAAYGAQNYNELSYIAARGIISSMVVIIPIISLLCLYMDTILIYIGEDPVASSYATQWYTIYALSLPILAIFQVIWKFLSAQNIMLPLVIVAVVSSGIILPTLLPVLGNQNVLGFHGTAVAFVIYQASQCILLIIYLYYFKPYHPKTFTGMKGISIRRVFTWENKFSTFLGLAAGGILAASEWIYWETLSLIIGTIGIIELSVHTIPSQTIMVMFMIPLGIGIALAVRIGNLLPISASRAKFVCWYGFCSSVCLFGILSIGMYHYRHYIYTIFTTEDDVIQGCELIWDKVVYYYFHLCIFGVNLGIATGLGQQWILGWLAIFFLWVIGLPTLYYMSIVQKGGLNAAWKTIWPCYAAMNVILEITFLTTNWDDVATKVRIRESNTLSHRSSITRGSPFLNNNVNNTKKVIQQRQQEEQKCDDKTDTTTYETGNLLLSSVNNKDNQHLHNDNNNGYGSLL